LLSSAKAKSAYWHFNTSHLKDVFRYFWDDFRNTKSSFQSLQQWWDFAKVQIQQLCKEYTVNVTRDITQSMKSLEKEIIELQELAENSDSQTHTESFKLKRKSLADLLEIKAQGALVRSRFQSVELMGCTIKIIF